VMAFCLQTAFLTLPIPWERNHLIHHFVASTTRYTTMQLYKLNVYEEK
jgi:hypothetical protein